MVLGKRYNYWATVVLAGFGIYSVIAVLETVSALGYFRHTGQGIDWNSFVANRVLEQYGCALFVGPIFWLVERFPLVGRAWRRHAGFLILAMIGFVLVKYAVSLPLYELWTGKPAEPFRLAVLQNAVPVLVDFAAVAGVAHALQYYRHARDRERSAADLKAQLVQARLDTLRGQLHPHFLFNTLNAVSSLMHENIDAADCMLTQLGDLLRLTLEREGAEITLGAEVELAQLYFAIMMHRFSDRLSVTWAVEDSVRDACVPPFLLQPLIENALEHGIARRRGPGNVIINANLIDGRVEILVADDGPGLVGPIDAGVGLANTSARLRELYGTDQSVRLEERPSGGTLVAVSLPFRKCIES